MTITVINSQKFLDEFSKTIEDGLNDASWISFNQFMSQSYEDMADTISHTCRANINMLHAAPLDKCQRLLKICEDLKSTAKKHDGDAIHERYIETALLVDEICDHFSGINDDYNDVDCSDGFGYVEVDV